MSLDQVKFLPRKQCGMDPASKEDCSGFWVSRVVVEDFESHLGHFDIKYCTKCRMGLTDPYPSEETSGYLYDEKVSADFDVIQEGLIDRIKDSLALRLLRSLSPFSDLNRVGHVLDYSCGNARFAASAESLFSRAEVHAVDYQETPPAIFARGTHPRMKYLTVEAFADDSQQYDLIVLRHVLEHTHDPVKLVRLLGSRLKPEGVLYIEVPNLDAGCARVFGNKWKGYYVPRHIFHYTVDSLWQIITTAGLEGKVEQNEMPVMGNMLAILFGFRKESRVVQSLGILLHPFQLAVGIVSGNATCINVKARRANATVA